MFTPGPWRVGKRGAVVTAVVTDQQVYATPAPPSVRTYYGGEVICETVTGGNAALIRCAPDMHDLLLKIQQQQYDLTRSDRAEVNRLLARAAGIDGR